jgi:TatD DNase family protein
VFFMIELVDSHCHVDFTELAQDFENITQRMQTNNVKRALCVSVNLTAWPNLIQFVEQHDNLWGSVGVHPDYENEVEPTVEDLVERSHHPKVVAIGETGLDYFRLQGDLDWQRERFRVHIRAARLAKLPLIIHTRSASEDTLKIMREEGADEFGGVMHCFTESLAVAEASITLGFYISLSGIVTFKNATDLQAVAQAVPLERLLIETDSPYLAPAPFRGKRNDPSLVRHVAEKVAELRGISFEAVAEATTHNFYQLFSKAQRP